MDKILYESIIRIFTSDINYDIQNPKNKIIEESSVGTGFFILPNIIITCSHVVDTSEAILFTIPMISNHKYSAKILCICNSLDIAILETIDYKSSSYLNIGQSDNILLQESIIVIGFPLGSDKQKITKGIVSGMEDGLIQIDSAINPGNSGGPLINKDNKVIGIITSSMLHASNIGYCIPINNLKIFINWKKDIYIYYECNLLSKFCNTSDDRILEINNKQINKIKSGITVRDLSTVSPLKDIGLDIGDLIIKFDNMDIDNYGNIKLFNDIKNIFRFININYYISRLLYGNNYNIKYYSSKKNEIIDDKIIFNNKHNFGVKKILPLYDILKYLYLGGLILTPLTMNALESHIGSRIRKQNKIKLFNNYVVVVNITPDSQFNITGNIKIGDLIYSINNIKINFLDDIIQIIKNTKEKFVTIVTYNEVIETISLEKINKNFEYN